MKYPRNTKVRLKDPKYKDKILFVVRYLDDKVYLSRTPKERETDAGVFLIRPQDSIEKVD